jgi:hypothetical protein
MPIIWKYLPEHKLEYFKFKNKHGYSFDNTESTIHTQNALFWIESHLTDNNIIVTPETTNTALGRIIRSLSNSIIILKKQTTADISEIVLSKPMMKAENEKLKLSLNSTDNIKVANLAGNQRKRILPFLFRPNEYAGEVILLDDSTISGTTIDAMKIAMPNATITKSLVLYGYTT